MNSFLTRLAVQRLGFVIYMKFKICSTCKIEKPVSEFALDKSLKTGISYRCKQCERNRINSRNKLSKEQKEIIKLKREISNLKVAIKLERQFNKYSQADNKQTIQFRRNYRNKRFILKRQSVEHFIKEMYWNISGRVNGKSINKSSSYYKGLDICSKDEFFDFALNNVELKKLFKNWELNNYQRKFIPSVDRIDPTIGYTIGNIQFLTQSDNTKKMWVDLKNRFKSS